MSLLLPPTSTNQPDWPRKVANAVNYLLGRQGFLGDPTDTAPTDPRISSIWIDSTDSNRAKVWDGTSWQALW